MLGFVQVLHEFQILLLNFGTHFFLEVIKSLHPLVWIWLCFPKYEGLCSSGTIRSMERYLPVCTLSRVQLVSLCLYEGINHSSSCVGNPYTKDEKRKTGLVKVLNCFLNSDSLSSSTYRAAGFLSQNGWPIFIHREGYSHSLFQPNLGI